MKVRPDGAERFPEDRWTDRETDMTKLTVAFRNFANAPKMRVPTLSVRLEQRRKGHSQPSHETVCVENDRIPSLYLIAAFLKLFSSGDHFHKSECSTDHPTLGIIKLIRPALNSV